jgi:hypothetical protein
LDCANLNIFEHLLGYYGIHPSILYRYNTALKKADLIDYTEFLQALTHVSDPRMAWGVWLKNKGNTTNITMRCGSIEFGNYTTRPETVDATARKVDVQVNIAAVTLQANVEVRIAAYTVRDLVSMISRVDSGGQTLSNFTNTVSNLLLNIQGTATANRPIILNFYFVPEANAVGTVFSPVSVGYSVLYEALGANIGTISLTGAQEIGKFILNRAGGVSANVKDAGRELSPGFIAVLTVSCASNNINVSDIQINLSTQDEF